MCSYRKFVKHDESYLLIVHCDDRLKHDGLLTLIRLFEYKNTGIRVLLVHDKHTTTYRSLTIHVSQCLHDSHIIQVKHAYFTYTYIYVHILYIYIYIYIYIL